MTNKNSDNAIKKLTKRVLQQIMAEIKQLHHSEDQCAVLWDISSILGNAKLTPQIPQMKELVNLLAEQAFREIDEFLDKTVKGIKDNDEREMRRFELKDKTILAIRFRLLHTSTSMRGATTKKVLRIAAVGTIGLAAVWAVTRLIKAGEDPTEAANRLEIFQEELARLDDLIHQEVEQLGKDAKYKDVRGFVQHFQEYFSDAVLADKLRERGLVNLASDEGIRWLSQNYSKK